MINSELFSFRFRDCHSIKQLYRPKIDPFESYRNRLFELNICLNLTLCSIADSLTILPRCKYTITGKDAALPDQHVIVLLADGLVYK